MCIAAEGQQGGAGRARGRQFSPGLLSSNCKATYPGGARPGDPVVLQHEMWLCSSEAWFPERSRGTGSSPSSPRPAPARCMQEKAGTVQGPRFPHRPLIHRPRGRRSSRVGARRRAKHHRRLLQLRRRNHLQACKHPGVAGKIMHPLAGTIGHSHEGTVVHCLAGTVVQLLAGSLQACEGTCQSAHTFTVGQLDGRCGILFGLGLLLPHLLRVVRRIAHTDKLEVASRDRSAVDFGGVWCIAIQLWPKPQPCAHLPKVSPRSESARLQGSADAYPVCH